MCVNTVNRQTLWGWWTARQMHTQPNHQQNPTSKSAHNIQNTRRANCAFCGKMRKTCQRCSHTYHTIPYTYIYSLLSHTRYLPPFFTTRFSRPINIITVFIIWCSSLSSSCWSVFVLVAVCDEHRQKSLSLHVFLLSANICYCLSVRLCVCICVIFAIKSYLYLKDAFAHLYKRNTNGRTDGNRETHSHTNQWPRNLATAIATFVNDLHAQQVTTLSETVASAQKAATARKAKEDSVQTYIQCTISVEKLTNFHSYRRSVSVVGGARVLRRRQLTGETMGQSSIAEVLLYLQKHCFTCAEKPIHLSLCSWVFHHRFVR